MITGHFALQHMYFGYNSKKKVTAQRFKRFIATNSLEIKRYDCFLTKVVSTNE
jgi:hypothetical protein